MNNRKLVLCFAMIMTLCMASVAFAGHGGRGRGHGGGLGGRHSFSGGLGSVGRGNTIRHNGNFGRSASFAHRWSRGGIHYHYHGHGRWAHSRHHYWPRRSSIHYHYYHRPHYTYHHYRPWRHYYWDYGYYRPWRYYWDSDYYWGWPAASFVTGYVIGSTASSSNVSSNYYYNVCAEGCNCLDRDNPTPCNCTENCYCNMYHNR